MAAAVIRGAAMQNTTTRTTNSFCAITSPACSAAFVAQSGVVYETNFHKIALYPPWAAATVPPAKCPARASTPILAAARTKIQRIIKELHN